MKVENRLLYHYSAEVVPKDTTEDHGRRAYLIDPTTKLISQVYVKDYKDIQQHIGCEMFTMAFRLDNADVLYMDDMGLIDGKPHDYFAVLDAYNAPLAGRGLLVGSNAQGGDEDVRTEILDLAMMVKWAESTS